MERRVYGLPGKTSAILQIPVGKASLQVEFSKGCTDRKSYRPACYATEDPTIQQMIEGSELFKKGTIRLVKVYSSGVPESEEGEGEDNVYPEVTTMKDAVVVLKAKGIAASQLKTKEAVKVAANEAGVSFPNFD